ncbi:MAG: radical SAM protein [Spirochaetales bacterium]|nr:radical SAM protein [Spirochaetales bacterium]
MPIKEILFIEPKTESLHIYSKFNLPRLGSALLATIMRKHGYQVRVCYMKEKEIYKKNISADLVALSTITATAPAAYRIAQFYRNKGIPTVIGGPHVTFCPEEALNYTDYCIRGEGESALPQLVSAINLKRSFKTVPGLVWKTKQKIHKNRTAAAVCNLDMLPFPDLSLIEYGYSSYGRNPFKKKIIPIQTSRGCPFDCTFCSVTGMFGKKYRYRSTDNIIAELQQYHPKKHYIFFYDDNFSANRKHTKELLQKMINLKLNFKWSTQVRADIAKDEELLKLMRQAGCRVLYIGFESCNEDALTEMHKSQSVKDMISSIEQIKKQNIYIHGMFVFGFDADTLQTLSSTINFAVSQPIDSAQFLILTPLPGTEFYSKLLQDKRIIDFNWAHYDAHHVKVKPKKINGLDLQNAQIKAHDMFYSPLNLLKKLFKGKVLSFFVGLYANNLNNKWKKAVQVYLWYLNSVVTP